MKNGIYALYGIFLILSGVASGHSFDLGLVQARFEGSTLNATLDLNPDLAAQLLKITTTPIKPIDFQSRADALLKLTLARGKLAVEAGECHWSHPEAELQPQLVRLSAVAECPGKVDKVKWELPLTESPEVPRSFELMVRVLNGDTEHVYVAEKGKPHLEFSVESAPSFWGFVYMGMEHIGADPKQWWGPHGLTLPDGIDHILFLLALILGGGTLLSLLGTATGFTVGHSVTLALASLNLVHLPSRFVESAIALSIAFIALENIIFKKSKHRWKIAAAFGLVHGFGFASALTALNLKGSALVPALFGFNIGVELGQAIIIAIVAPLIFWLRKAPVAEKLVLKVGSFFIFIAGSYWFITRAFGI